MKSKHTFNVFVDNFKTAYKFMLFMVIIFAAAAALNFAVIYPIISRLFESTQFTDLVESVKTFFTSFINGNMDGLSGLSAKISENFKEFLSLIAESRSNIIWGVILILFIYLVQSFLLGLGKYATSILINDKMALQARSPFLNSLIKDFGRACKYNAIYVPMSVVYDMLCIFLLYILLFVLLKFIPVLLALFLFFAAIVFAFAVKKSFVAGWLPAMICGKKSCLEAMKYSFTNACDHFWELCSDFVLYILIIVAVTVASAIFTFGVGLLICIPASYIVVLSYKFVNYYDENNLKYFTGPDAIVKPKKEAKPTREEFFRGEQ